LLITMKNSDSKTMEYQIQCMVEKFGMIWGLSFKLLQD
jgi:hypothetical protein